MKNISFTVLLTTLFAITLIPAHSDPQAEALEKQCLAAAHKVRTFQAHFEVTYTGTPAWPNQIGRISETNKGVYQAGYLERNG